MSLGEFSHQEGIWGIWKYDGEISIYSLEQDDINAHIYDNWVLQKGRLTSFLEMGKDPAWLEAYEREKKEAETYSLAVNKELSLNGTTVSISRKVTLDRNTTNLDEAKAYLLKEMEKVNLIKVG